MQQAFRGVGRGAGGQLLSSAMIGGKAEQLVGMVGGQRIGGFAKRGGIVETGGEQRRPSRRYEAARRKSQRRMSSGVDLAPTVRHSPQPLGLFLQPVADAGVPADIGAAIHVIADPTGKAQRHAAAIAASDRASAGGQAAATRALIWSRAATWPRAMAVIAAACSVSSVMVSRSVRGDTDRGRRCNRASVAAAATASVSARDSRKVGCAVNTDMQPAAVPSAREKPAKSSFRSASPDRGRGCHRAQSAQSVRCEPRGAGAASHRIQARRPAPRRRPRSPIRRFRSARQFHGSAGTPG